MTSEMPMVSGNFGMQLIDDIFAMNSTNETEEDKKSGDIFDALFRAIDQTIEETSKNNENNNNMTNSIQESSFGPPFGMQIEGFDYFS